MKTLAISFLLVSVSLGMEREQSLRVSSASSAIQQEYQKKSTPPRKKIFDSERLVNPKKARKPIFDTKESLIQTFDAQYVHTKKQSSPLQLDGWKAIGRLLDEEIDSIGNEGKIVELTQENEEPYTPVNKLYKQMSSSRKYSFEEEVYYTGPRGVHVLNKNNTLIKNREENKIYSTGRHRQGNCAESLFKQFYNQPLKSPQPDLKHRNIIMATNFPLLKDIKWTCQANGVFLENKNNGISRFFNPEKSSTEKKIQAFKNSRIQQHKTEGKMKYSFRYERAILVK